MSRALDDHNNGDCGGPPLCYYCGKEDSETLGNCGCVDYHMADCPIRTSTYDMESLEEWWLEEAENEAYRYEENWRKEHHDNHQ